MKEDNLKELTLGSIKGLLLSDEVSHWITKLVKDAVTEVSAELVNGITGKTDVSEDETTETEADCLTDGTAETEGGCSGEDLEQLLDFARRLGWYCRVSSISKEHHGGYSYGTRSYVVMLWDSPAGEEIRLHIYIDNTNPVGTFMQNLKAETDIFDVDRHVQKVLPAKGKGNCPDSIEELVKDAKEIQRMFVLLYTTLRDALNTDV